MHLLAAPKDDLDPVAIVFLCVILALALIGCVVVVVRRVNDLVGNNKIFRVRFRRYIGRDFDTLQTHDKKFPGYDLASLHRALSSFREEFCSESIEVGGATCHTLAGDARHKARRQNGIRLKCNCVQNVMLRYSEASSRHTSGS